MDRSTRALRQELVSSVSEQARRLELQDREHLARLSVLAAKEREMDQLKARAR